MKKRTFILLSAYLNYIFQGIGAIILSQNMDSLKLAWGATTAQVSLVISAIGIGRILSLYIGGYLSDHVGRKRSVLLGVVSFIIFFLGIILSPNYIVAFIVTLFAGFSNALFDTGIYPLVTELYTEEKQKNAISILNKAFISFGQFILPFIISGLAIAGASFKWTYVICAVSLLINGIWLYRLPVDDVIEAQEEPEVVDTAPMEKRSFIRYGVPMLFFSFASISLFNTFTLWVPQYAEQMTTMSLNSGRFLVSIYSVCSLTSVFITSFFLKRGVNRITVMMVGMGVSALGLFGLILMPTKAMFIVASMIIGLFAAGGIWQLGLLTTLDFFGDYKGKYTSYYGLATAVSIAVIPYVTGLVADEHLTWVFILDAFFAIVGFIMAVISWKNMKTIKKLTKQAA